ncbi:MAG: type IIA DNA topoisomerase subunit B [Actinobacteria bacterium]|nr:type IIA DNA topoisomerase subunit B [Actinomycetota bacterium]
MSDTTGAAKRARYSAKDLTVLEGLDAVRKRPGMYIGSTDERGLMHCLWEIIDNAVDEALAGHCKSIVVVLEADGSASVTDNGRGIPVDVDSKSKLTGVQLVMTKLHAGGKFGGGSYTASGGLHGVGASVVNALSARLDVAVDRAGRTHEMSFRRGVPGVFDGAGPDASFTRKSGLRQTGKVSAKRTGTRVRFWPDPQVFTPGAGFDIDALLARARQTAFLVPGLSLTIRDERLLESSPTDDPIEETFRFAGGIGEYVDFLSRGEAVTGVIRLTGQGHFHETVPVLDGKGHLASKEVERTLDVDVALRWSNDYDTRMQSFVNIIATPKGGTHLVGFDRAMAKTINEALRAGKVLRASEDNVTKDDIYEGLTAVVTVRLPEPQFEGQTKEVLGTPAASRIVSHVVAKHLKAWFAAPPHGQKAPAKQALEKIANASRARIAARTSRDVQRRKNALESSALPAKLADCRSSQTEQSELFIVEGDSALGTAKLARNSEFQALLPIRGKILNVQKASMADMLKNAECAAIIQVVGAGSGPTFDLESVRYQKIVLMTDADVDGAHIRCLLLTLFQRYMRPLLEEGRVYAAVPPLHRLELVHPSRKANEVVYTYSDAEMKRVLADAGKRGIKVKDPVQRYKGLGEMDAKQLRETTMDPAHRLLRRITANDAEAACEVFDLLMGSDVAPRKDFIVSRADEIDRSRVDV